MSIRNKLLRMFHVPIVLLIVPTLEIMSQAVANDTMLAITCYYNRFSSTLLKHLTTETELHIVNGQLTTSWHLVISFLSD